MILFSYSYSYHIHITIDSLNLLVDSGHIEHLQEAHTNRYTRKLRPVKISKSISALFVEIRGSRPCDTRPALEYRDRGVVDRYSLYDGHRRRGQNENSSLPEMDDGWRDIDESKWPLVHRMREELKRRLEKEL